MIRGGPTSVPLISTCKKHNGNAAQEIAEISQRHVHCHLMFLYGCDVGASCPSFQLVRNQQTFPVGESPAPNPYSYGQLGHGTLIL